MRLGGFAYALLTLLLALTTTCSHTPGYGMDAAVGRDAAAPPDAFAWTNCIGGQTRCFENHFQRCVAAGEFTVVQDNDCSPQSLTCVDPQGCLPCAPNSLGCNDAQDTILTCRSDGSGWDPTGTCDVTTGNVCTGGHCIPLCQSNEIVGTNIGCEYFAADLDNAQLGPGMDAYAQPYAIVVSNPSPNLTARVHIDWNSAPQGQPVQAAMVASALVPPMDLEVFMLPERQVDCPAMMSDYDTGTGTCLSSQAYHVVSTIPVIAFEFNPVANTYDFSNDASLLIPTNSLSGDYIAMGWAQTLASSPPQVVLNPGSPDDLRGALTVIGIAPNTHVHVVPAADVLGGNVSPNRIMAGTPVDLTIGPFDVLNLETDGFQADLTGSVVTADQPVVVFSGSECSDVPIWSDLNDRKCCCDHLEAQQFPRNTIGAHYFAVHTPNRTPVVSAAGAPVAVLDNEPEYFRILAVTPGTTHVTTTVPSTLDDPTSAPLAFDLTQGQYKTVPAYRSFQLDASAPVSVANFMSSQLNTGIPLVYPGGDPSFIPIPPTEQWRASYVFLTPDNYAFDFVQITAPASAQVQLDGNTLPTPDCSASRADGCVASLTHTCPTSAFSVWTCQLSYPIISPNLPYPMNVAQGEQHDGVHVVQASAPVGVIVSGFDLRVSYGYPAGTQLAPLF